MQAHAVTVAHAAPSTPIRGKGPQPKIRNGPSSALRPTAHRSTRNGVRVSPAARMTHSQVKPIIDDGNAVIGGLQDNAVDPPLSGNVQNDMITLGMRQYDPPSGRDGHFVVFDVQTANDDMVRFFGGSVSGIPEIGQ